MPFPINDNGDECQKMIIAPNTASLFLNALQWSVRSNGLNSIDRDLIRSIYTVKMSYKRFTNSDDDGDDIDSDTVFDEKPKNSNLKDEPVISSSSTNAQLNRVNVMRKRFQSVINSVSVGNSPGNGNSWKSADAGKSVTRSWSLPIGGKVNYKRNSQEKLKDYFDCLDNFG